MRWLVGKGVGQGSQLLLLLLQDAVRVPITTLPSPSYIETGNYTCEFCGKQYKYYTPYQEHVALHAPISEYLLLLGGEGVQRVPGIRGSAACLGEGATQGELGVDLPLGTSSVLEMLGYSSEHF